MSGSNFFKKSYSSSSSKFSGVLKFKDFFFAKVSMLDGIIFWPRFALLAGWDYTAKISWLEYTKDSKAGTENSGVPIKTIFCDINFRLLLSQFLFSV